MYSNNFLNSQESTTILMSVQNSLETYWMHHVPILNKHLVNINEAKLLGFDLEIQ